MYPNERIPRLRCPVTMPLCRLLALKGYLARLNSLLVAQQMYVRKDRSHLVRVFRSAEGLATRPKLRELAGFVILIHCSPILEINAPTQSSFY